MTVLVIGGNGFVGAPLVRALRARGREVVAMSRGGGGPCGVACNRGDLPGVVALVAARGVDTVIDLLAYTEADTLPLFEALGGRVGRYVLASSMDVYRNYEGLHRKADPGPIVGPLDEGAPLRTARYPYRSDPRRPADAVDAWCDDYDKIPLEEALRRADLRHTVLRLPMIYGPGDRQQRFRWAISPMAAGRRRLTIDPAWAAWRTTYGFVDDVADALAQAAVHSGAPDRTFNLGEPESPDHEEWVRRFARTLDWRGDVALRPAPPGSPIADLDLRYSLVADTGAFRQACGWREPTALEERLERTVAEQRSRDVSAR
jgi:nucleoside-diphosphate-sugar epimerase